MVPCDNKQGLADRFGLSRTHQIPLVDLAEEMKDYDSLLEDGLHFNEVGIRLKGELIGEGIFELLKEQYHLTG